MDKPKLEKTIELAKDLDSEKKKQLKLGLDISNHRTRRIRMFIASAASAISAFSILLAALVYTNNIRLTTEQAARARELQVFLAFAELEANRQSDFIEAVSSFGGLNPAFVEKLKQARLNIILDTPELDRTLARISQGAPKTVFDGFPSAFRALSLEDGASRRKGRYSIVKAIKECGESGCFIELVRGMNDIQLKTKVSSRVANEYVRIVSKLLHDREPLEQQLDSDPDARKALVQALTSIQASSDIKTLSRLKFIVDELNLQL
ncbi:MAG: hypothetical protein GY952_05880 [Rhodobacteraceae bacterium]|nr:hypothetical protein [Paracoccaceae bacterium]